MVLRRKAHLQVTAAHRRPMVLLPPMVLLRQKPAAKAQRQLPPDQLRQASLHRPQADRLQPRVLRLLKVVRLLLKPAPIQVLLQTRSLQLPRSK
jgi:hypothetical protein